MQEVRRATMDDLDAIRSLWKVCFDDTDAFIDWFFCERFLPEYAACMEVDGTIVSAMQSVPLHVRVRDCVVPASMLAGVSTDPGCRGKGYMKRVFAYYMHLMRSMHLPLVVHTPAHLSTFFSCGHYPVSETQHVTFAQAPAGQELERHALNADLAGLQACYQAVMSRYSGSVSRTLADFAYKMRDYASDGAQCIAYTCAGDVQGYGVFFETGNGLHAEEVLAREQNAYERVIQGLCFEAQGRQLHVKLPPDVQLSFKGATRVVRAQGVAGAADIAQLLRIILHDEQFTFEVIDAVVPENQGVYNGMGQPENSAPHVTLPAGRLVQFLIGSRSMQELIEAGEAIAHDRSVLDVLDVRLPKYACYIVDEY